MKSEPGVNGSLSNPIFFRCGPTLDKAKQIAIISLQENHFMPPGKTRKRPLACMKSRYYWILATVAILVTLARYIEMMLFSVSLQRRFTEQLLCLGIILDSLKVPWLLPAKVFSVIGRWPTVQDRTTSNTRQAVLPKYIFRFSTTFKLEEGRPWLESEACIDTMNHFLYM